MLKMNSKKKILLIGGNGYIGSELQKTLKKDKRINFVSFDNFLYGNNSFKNTKIFSKKKDLRDLNEKFIKQFDCVIFLAALTNNPIDNLFPNKSYKEVYKYTAKFIDICKKNNIKFIWPSSCSVYGERPNQILSEKSKIKPITFYSKNKADIEKYLIKKADKKFCPVILRLATIYGYSDHMRFDLVINMLVSMLIQSGNITLNSDGSAMRPHVSLKEISAAFHESIFLNNKKIIFLNVGNNKNNFTILEVANKIVNLKKGAKIKFLNSNDKLYSDSLVQKKDKRTYAVNFNKIKKTFGNKFPNVKLKDEISTLYKKLKKKYGDNNFKDIKFYRLHKIKRRIIKKQVNKNTLRVK